MNSIPLLLAAILALAPTVALSNEEAEAIRSRRKTAETPVLSVRPWGPTAAEVQKAKQRASADASVQSFLGTTNRRILAFEALENGSMPPTRYRVYFYDYAAGRTVIAESDFAARTPFTLSQSDMVPGVSEEELSAAREIISKDSSLPSGFRSDKASVYEAMPPITVLGSERLVNVGIKDAASGTHAIVGISFRTGKVVRYEGDAPPTALASPSSCGIPAAGQGSTGSGVAGQYQLALTQNSQPLWEMIVIRPSSSSGYALERSGIEIRDVKYRGKSVLKRAHAPILNVRYEGDVCGPFRDWQYSEGYFQIPTTNVTYPNGEAGGFAVIGGGGVPTTVVESRNDAGNFRGVAVYQQDIGNGNELVLVTEMNAGWYRYIMEWRFAPDGTIRPRYGFGSIENSCVCSKRTHHVYWRFDFDVVQPGNKVFRAERGRRFLRPIETEAAFFRNSPFNRRVVVQNGAGDEAYMLVPGEDDGAVATPTGQLFDNFGVGDFWVLRYAGTDTAPSEIDDPNPFGNHVAAINPWVSGQTVWNQNVVVWYAAHQTRIDDSSLTEWRENIIDGKHVVGPELRPLRW